MEHRLEQRRAELTAVEAAADAAGLAARSRELQGQVAVAEAHLGQLREQASEELLEDLEQRMAGLREAVDRRSAAAALRERELTLERLRERIQVVSGGGLEERLGAQGAGSTSWCANAADTGARSKTLDLLLRVLRDAERDAKERYVGPVLRRLRPDLQALFPGAELEIDDAFRITAAGCAGAFEPFERLSEGTREQLAILPAWPSPSCSPIRAGPRSSSWTTRSCSPTISGSSRCSRSWRAPPRSSRSSS